MPRSAPRVTARPAAGLAASVATDLGLLLQRSLRARLYGALTEAVGHAVDETTYPVLSGLDRTGACTAAELALAIGLDRSGVSRRATRLEAGGLLRRSADPEDARAVVLTLTRSGQAAVATMRERLVAAIEADLRQWPPGQAHAFTAGLHRFVTEGPFR